MTGTRSSSHVRSCPKISRMPRDPRCMPCPHVFHPVRGLCFFRYELMALLLQATASEQLQTIIRSTNRNRKGIILKLEPVMITEIDVTSCQYQKQK